MNKKLIITLLCVFLTACSAPAAALESFDAAQIVPVIMNTAEPTSTPTATIIPTPTIGYQATAVIAQQTAEAAERLNVAVTAEAEQRVHQEMSWTAESDARAQEILARTAT